MAANPFYDSLNAKMVSDAASSGLVGLGVGAAGAGLAGILRTLRRNVAPPTHRYPGAIVAQVPYPVPPGDDVSDEDGDPLAPPAKAASWLFDPKQVTQKDSLPLYYPLTLGAAGLGVAGGWKGVDALFGRRRKAEQDEETGRAKAEFQKALLDSQSDKLGAEKTAGERLGEALDALYDAVPAEKRANWHDMVGKTIGGYLGAYALPTAALGGVLAYNRAVRTSDGAVLRKAVNRRLRRAYQSRPSEVFAVPVPTPSAGATPEQVAVESAGRDDDPAALAVAATEPPPFKPRRRIDRPPVA